MTFFDQTKSLVENLYFLSSSLLFLVSLIGLYQLIITKMSLKINSARDAAKFSYHITEEYAQKFEKSVQELYKALIAKDIEEHKGKITDFSYLEYEKLDSTWREQWEEKYVEFESELIELINLLEGYSTPFIKKIADEDIAFNLDCYQFTELVEICYPYIIKKHNGDNLNLYCLNTIELYKHWNSRLDKMQMNKEYHELKKKISLSQKVKPIKPLGTE